MALSQILIFGLIQGSYIAIAAIGFTLIYGIIDMIDFAYAENITIGAYLGYVAIAVLGLSLPIAMIVVVIGSAVVGWIVARIFFRPIEHTGAVPLILASYGTGIVLRNVIRLTAGTESYFIEYKESAQIQFDLLGGFFVTDKHLLVIGISIGTFVLFHLLLTRTKIGTAMRATKDNENLARVTGVDTRRISTYVWLLGSALAGLSGVLLISQRAATPMLGFDQILIILTVAILGGAGNPYGAIVAAYVLGIAMALTTGVLPTWASNLSETMAFGVLIIILLVRPGGITGQEVDT